MSSPIAELALVLFVASLLGLAARWLKQPPLLGYILTGFVLGPLGSQIVRSEELLTTFSEIGIVLLLFLVGLELDWSHLIKVGRSILNLALLQVVLTFALGYSSALLLGLAPIPAVVIGFTLTFSSTIVVIQLIAAKNDVQSLYGKLAVALLIIQDLLAVIVLVLINSFNGNGGASLSQIIIELLVKLIGLFLVTSLLGVKLSPHLFKSLAKNRDLMVVMAIAWCFVVAVTAHFLGFSYEIGAFLAGLSLAGLPYTVDIFGQIRPLRDFFIVLFFVLLGFSFTPQGVVDWSLVVMLVGLAVIAKPILILISLTALRYRIRTSFLTALSLGQMSEFSVILVLAASTHGLIDNPTVSAITIATAISFAFSSYLISAADRIYTFIRPFIMPLQLKGPAHYLEEAEELRDHVIIFGYHRMGFHILKLLRKLKHDVLVVDFNPDVIERLQKQGIPSVFGDASDSELLETIHLGKAKMVISTIPHTEENLMLIQHIRSAHRDVAMIATADDIDDALTLYKSGVDYVIIPKLLSGKYVAELLDKYSRGTLRSYLKRHRSDAKLLKARNHDLYL